MTENKSKSVGMMTTIALIVSAAWIIIGFIGNLYGAALAVGMTVWHVAFTGLIAQADLVLIPFVVKEIKWAFLATMIVGITAFLVALLAGPGYTLITSGWQNTTDYNSAVGGGIIWIILQIPVIVFAFRDYRKL
jgi:cytochrome c oxidase assembly factor CtaG